MAFRFVHTADIHLDSPLASLALRDAGLAGLIGTATRRALTGIVDHCITERADALVIAGDLYDGDQTSMKTAHFLAGEMKRLDDAGIGVFVIRGNHDALSKITKELVLPDNVTVFGVRDKPVLIERAGAAFDVSVHGVSFASPHAPDSLLPRYQPPVDGAVNIGLMHTSLDGAPGHDPYGPCPLKDLQNAGYQYWALGHIHQRAVHRQSGCTVVMPGIPQGRNIGEDGARTASVVTIADDCSITVGEYASAIARFERIQVDAGGLTDWRALAGAMAQALDQARAAVACEVLVARLVISGATDLSWQMRRDSDVLLAQARECAAQTGGTHIDKIENTCSEPQAGDGEGATAGGPLNELRALMNDEVITSAAFFEEFTRAAEDLQKKLPKDCRDLLGTGPGEFEDILRALARQGCDDVVARLRGTPGREKP